MELDIGLFLTSRPRVLNIGGFIIRDRRRKPDEPFNPFAANANQVRQKKRNERSQSNAPNSPSQGRVEPRQPVDANDFRKKQEEARKRLGAQASPSSSITQKPAIQASELNAKTDTKTVQQVSREDRLAELRKQSQASVKKTESILEPVATATSQPNIEVIEPVVESSQESPHSPEPLQPSIEAEPESISAKNVFKQIVTKTPKKREHRRRRSRHDDSGGGRQPKVKKLNRQRYNDYKYAARDILDDDRVADEHRSNLLGQIWAKGERIGIDASLEFISEKEEQLIIDDEIAQRLRDLVKALTTRR